MPLTPEQIDAIASGQNIVPDDAATAAPGDQPDIHAIVDSAADEYKIPRDIFRGVIGLESSFNPQATNHGAIGLGQVRGPALEDFNAAHGTHFDPEDLKHPTIGAKTSAWYLSTRDGANWDDKRRAYNQGNAGAAAGKGHDYLGMIKGAASPGVAEAAAPPTGLTPEQIDAIVNGTDVAPAAPSDDPVQQQIDMSTASLENSGNEIQKLQDKPYSTPVGLVPADQFDKLSDEEMGITPRQRIQLQMARTNPTIQTGRLMGTAGHTIGNLEGARALSEQTGVPVNVSKMPPTPENDPVSPGLMQTLVRYMAVPDSVFHVGLEIPGKLSQGESGSDIWTEMKAAGTGKTNVGWEHVMETYGVPEGTKWHIPIGAQYAAQGAIAGVKALGAGTSGSADMAPPIADIQADPSATISTRAAAAIPMDIFGSVLNLVGTAGARAYELADGMKLSEAGKAMHLGAIQDAISAIPVEQTAERALAANEARTASEKAIRALVDQGRGDLVSRGGLTVAGRTIPGTPKAAELIRDATAAAADKITKALPEGSNHVINKAIAAFVQDWDFRAYPQMAKRILPEYRNFTKAQGQQLDQLSRVLFAGMDRKTLDDVTLAIDRDAINTLPEKFQKQAQDIKQVQDGWRAIEKSKGIGGDYLEDYMMRIWDNYPELTRRGAGGASAGMTANMGRELDSMTIEEIGRRFGLKPKTLNAKELFLMRGQSSIRAQAANDLMTKVETTYGKDVFTKWDMMMKEPAPVPGWVVSPKHGTPEAGAPDLGPVVAGAPDPGKIPYKDVPPGMFDHTAPTGNPYSHAPGPGEAWPEAAAAETMAVPGAAQAASTSAVSLRQMPPQEAAAKYSIFPGAGEAHEIMVDGKPAGTFAGHPTTETNFHVDYLQIDPEFRGRPGIINDARRQFAASHPEFETYSGLRATGNPAKVATTGRLGRAAESPEQELARLRGENAHLTDVANAPADATRVAQREAELTAPGERYDPETWPPSLENYFQSPEWQSIKEGGRLRPAYARELENTLANGKWTEATDKEFKQLIDMGIVYPPPPGYDISGLAEPAEMNVKMIPRDIKEAMDSLGDRYKPGMFISGVDKFNNAWKTSVTAFWPGFYVRNAAGDLSRAYLKAGMAALNPVKNWEAIQMARGAEGRIFTKTGEVYNFANLERQLQEQGLFGGYGEMLGRDAPVGEGYGFVAKMRRAGSAENDHFRRLLAMEEVRNGYTPEMAAIRAKRATIDYENMSPFRRDVLRRAIPFQQYMIENAKLQAKMLFSEPGRQAAMLRLFATHGDQDQINEDLKKYAPYVSEGVMKIIGKDQQGGDLFFSIQGMPIEDINRFWPQTRSSEGKTGAIFRKNVTAMLNPLIRAPLEEMADKDMYMDRPITEMNTMYDVWGKAFEQMPKPFRDFVGWEKTISARGDTVYKMDPYQLHLVRSFVLSRLYSTVGKAFDTRKDWGTRTFNFLTGMSFGSLSWEQNQLPYYRQNSFDRFRVTQNAMDQQTRAAQLGDTAVAQ